MILAAPVALAQAGRAPGTPPDLPYTYTRYYEKLKTEIMQDSCEDEE